METVIKGPDAIRKRLDEIEEKGFEATPKEKNLVTILEIALGDDRAWFLLPKLQYRRITMRLILKFLRMENHSFRLLRR